MLTAHPVSQARDFLVPDETGFVFEAPGPEHLERFLAQWNCRPEKQHAVVGRKLGYRHRANLVERHHGIMICGMRYLLIRGINLEVPGWVDQDDRPTSFPRRHCRCFCRKLCGSLLSSVVVLPRLKCPAGVDRSEQFGLCLG